MKRNGTIMPKYWVKLVLGARAIGADWLTHDYLAIAHAAAKGTLPVEAVPEPAPSPPADHPADKAAEAA
jgi:hypothetical protein